MIDRHSELGLVRAALKRSRVVASLGPRQSGQTTLARQFVPAESLKHFDLEDPQRLARLAEPDTARRPLKGLVVFDEIQRRFDLFPLRRVLAGVIDPGLTTVRYPLVELRQRAFEVFRTLYDSRSRSIPHEQLATKLVVRRRTDPACPPFAASSRTGPDASNRTP